MADRNITIEQQKLADYSKLYGKNPNFSDPKEKARFYALSYPTELPTGTEGLDMSEYNRLTGKKTFTPITSPTASTNPNQNIQNAQGQFNQATGINNEMFGGQAQLGANNIMTKLQDLIIKKENLLNPNLGPSALSQMAGLTGMGGLSGALSNQQMQLQAQGRDIDFALSRASSLLENGLNAMKYFNQEGNKYLQLATEAQQKAEEEFMNSLTTAINNGVEIDENTWNLLPESYKQYKDAWKVLAENTRKNKIAEANKKYMEDNDGGNLVWNPETGQYEAPKGTSGISGSPITSKEILNSAEKYGLSWEALTALIQHESLLGTSNIAKNNNNFGGITWSEAYEKSHPGVTKGSARPSAEGGYYVKFPDIQSGIDAVAEQLARRKTTNPTAKSIKAGDAIYDMSTYATDPKQAQAIQNYINKIGKFNNAEDIDKYISGGKQISSKLSSLAKSVYDNPQTLKNYTPTQKAEIVAELKNNGIDIYNLVPTNWNNTLELASNKLSNDSKLKDVNVKQSLSQAITLGDNPLNAVKDLTTKTFNEKQNQQYVSFEATLDVIDEIEKAMENKGTNRLTGSLNNVLISLGFSAGDATTYMQLLSDFAKNAYTNAISGASFTEKEAKRYEKLFPQSGKSASLNLENVKALKTYMNTVNNSIFATKLGTDTWNKLKKDFGDEQPKQTTNTEKQKTDYLNGTIIGDMIGNKGQSSGGLTQSDLDLLNQYGIK